jgi:hypothetical protein
MGKERGRDAEAGPSSFLLGDWLIGDLGDGDKDEWG